MSFVCKALAMTLAAVAVSASAASAAEYAYHVNGKTLGTGETQEIRAKVEPGHEFTITSKAAGLSILIKAKKAKLNAVSKPAISGGIPGTSSETLEFEELAGTYGGAPCEKVGVEVTPTVSQLVRVVLPKGKAGHLATLLEPLPGKALMKLNLTNCGGLSNAIYVTGSIAAEVSPEAAEALGNKLIFKEGEVISEVELSSKTTKTVGLSSTALNGALEVELVNGLAFGVY